MEEHRWGREEVNLLDMMVTEGKLLSLTLENWVGDSFRGEGRAEEGRGRGVDWSREGEDPELRLTFRGRPKKIHS